MVRASASASRMGNGAYRVRIYVGLRFASGGRRTNTGALLQVSEQEETARVGKETQKSKVTGDLPGLTRLIARWMTCWKLVVNLKTARALNLKIPQSIMLRTDRVIKQE